MISLNRAQVLGRMTRDAEMRYTPNGKAVANFSVATNRRWKDADGNTQDLTEYHDIVAWGKLAEIANQFLKKGDPVYIDGRLQTRQWEGPEGAKRQRTEIVAENLISLSGRTGERFQTSEPAQQQDKPASQQEKKQKNQETKSESDQKTKSQDKKDDEIDLDDIPF